jgi:hypothetical protein
MMQQQQLQQRHAQQQQALERYHQQQVRASLRPRRAAGEATAEVATAHPTRAEAAASGGIETIPPAAIRPFSSPLQKQYIDCLPQRGSVIYDSSRESRFKAGAAPQLWGAERRRLLQVRLPTESMKPMDLRG